MKARTNLRPSMESLMPGLQFEKKLSKLVEIWFTSDENATANFFLGHPVCYFLLINCVLDKLYIEGVIGKREYMIEDPVHFFHYHGKITF